MKPLQRRNSLLLVLAAFIWGIAFVAQSEGGKSIGPYTFNGIRFLLGAAVLCPVIFLMNKKNTADSKGAKPANRRALLIGGLSCGFILGIASTLQQLALFYGSTAGKAGFLTTCYIIIVPLLGLFLGKKCGWNIWVGTVLTLIGLYLLCMNGSFTLEFPDLLLLLCALGFSLHILCVDHFSPMVDGIKLSCMQFLVAGIVSLIPAFFVDLQHSFANVPAMLAQFAEPTALIALLYTGILSSGVAYTLQVIGQKGLNPTVASLLMSLESVFSVLGGWVLLHEHLSGRELLGCLLIFVAVVLAQIPVQTLRKQHAD